MSSKRAEKQGACLRVKWGEEWPHDPGRSGCRGGPGNGHREWPAQRPGGGAGALHGGAGSRGTTPGILGARGGPVAVERGQSG